MPHTVIDGVQVLIGNYWNDEFVLGSSNDRGEWQEKKRKWDDREDGETHDTTEVGEIPQEQPELVADQASGSPIEAQGSASQTRRTRGSRVKRDLGTRAPAMPRQNAPRAAKPERGTSMAASAESADPSHRRRLARRYFDKFPIK